MIELVAHALGQGVQQHVAGGTLVFTVGILPQDELGELGLVEKHEVGLHIATLGYSHDGRFEMHGHTRFPHPVFWIKLVGHCPVSEPLDQLFLGHYIGIHSDVDVTRSGLESCGSQHVVAEIQSRQHVFQPYQGGLDVSLCYTLCDRHTVSIFEDVAAFGQDHADLPSTCMVSSLCTGSRRSMGTYLYPEAALGPAGANNSQRLALAFH